MALKVIILAAGRGSRMKSDLPKVLHCIAGISLIQQAIQKANQLNPAAILPVIGWKKDEIVKHCEKNLATEILNKISWCLQEEQLGTAHAVQSTLSHIENEDTVIITYADVPLIQLDTLAQMVSAINNSKQTLILSAILKNPQGYGRILRNQNNQITDIIEQKDLQDNQDLINEINTGFLCIAGDLLKEYIEQIDNKNSQNEYYLTDIVKILTANKIPIHSIILKNDTYQIQGINDKIQLEALERKYQKREAQNLMRAGVTILDSKRFDLRGKITHKSNLTIDINCIFEGNNVIGNNVKIQANCYLKNVVIDDNVTVHASSYLEDCHIKLNATIGPFARIRPNSTLEENAKVGNFVEIKNTSVGKNSKIPHLSYIGDAIIGESVNIGAGVITCNYDGCNKHQTNIEDNCFIGSNSSLIAPITLEENAKVGAGSTLSKKVEANSLTLTRAALKSIPNFNKKK